MDKILSIIIPTYNMEKYLRNGLSSLLIGEHQDMLDVMIVNDGSKDSSLDIAREFEEKYPEMFHVIDKPNGNYGSCVNRGLKEAKGKYVKILDADDSYDTNAFSQLVDRLSNVDVDMCITDYIIVNDNGEKTSEHKRCGVKDGMVQSAEDFLEKCVEDKIMMHEIVYRTQLLRDMNYTQTEGIAFTDTEWSLLPLLNVETICYFELFVYKYLVGRQGQTVDPKRAVVLQAQANKTLFHQIEEFGKMNGLTEKKRRYMIAFLLRNIRFTYRTYLVTSYKQLSNDELHALDNRLKELNMELYSLMDSERVQPSVPILFVKDWRKNGGKATMSVKFYRSILFPLLRRMGKV